MTVEKNRWINISIAILICLAGFRGEIGLDTQSYSSWFRTLPPIDNLFKDSFNRGRFEPLFVILCSLCKVISDSWLLPQFIFAIIINASFLLYIKRNVNYFFVGALLFLTISYYVLNCEEIRQAVAFAIILFGLPYLEEGGKKKYFLFVLVAIGFHYSSVVFLLIPFIPNLFKKPLYLITLGVIVLIVASLFRENMAYSLAFLSNDYLNAQASLYSESVYGTQVNRSLMNILNVSFIQIGIPLFFFYNIKDKSRTLPMLFVFYILAVLANFQVLIIYRFIHVLQIVTFIILAKGIEVARYEKFGVNTRLFLIIMFILFLYSSISNSVFGYDYTFEKYRYELFVPYKLFQF